MNEPSLPRFYFALPRLLSLLRRGDPRRSEMNGVEAWAGSIGIFLVSYLFFAAMVPDNLAWWVAAPAHLAVAFLVWLLWLLDLYLNSLILKLVRACGLFRSLRQRRGQSVLVGLATTIMALQLLQRGAFSGEVGAIWLVAVAMNLIAALVLALLDGNAVRS